MSTRSMATTIWVDDMVHKVVKNSRDAVIFGDKFIITFTKGNNFLENRDASGKVIEKLGFTIHLDGLEKKTGDEFGDVFYGYMTKKSRDRKFDQLVKKSAMDKERKL
jgi:hypothetical protein